MLQLNYQLAKKTVSASIEKHFFMIFLGLFYITHLCEFKIANIV